MGLKQWAVGRSVAENRRQSMAGKLGSGAKGIWQVLDGWKTWIVCIVMALKLVFPDSPAWGYASAIFSALGWSAVAPEVDPGALAGWGMFLGAVGHRLWKAVAQIRAGVPLKDVLSTPPPKIALQLSDSASTGPLARAIVVALLLAPGMALAQEAPDPDAVVIEIEAGAQAVVTRDARDDRGAARATLDAPLPEGFRAAIRIEASGLQAGGDLPFDPYNPRTFRAVQGIVEIRKQLATGFALGIAGGATWSIEGNDGPRDPRLYTALLLARVPLPGHGWARLGGGHHGPVGGWSAVAAIAYPAGPGRLLIDYALPVVAVDAAGAPRPGVLTTMVSVPLKRWTLGGKRQ